MNISNDQYLGLKLITTQLIKMHESSGHELQLNEIDGFIEQAISFSKIECDEDVKRKLFVDIEYEFKIVHPKGQAIFDKYDEPRNWYTLHEHQSDFFWLRYKEHLIKNTSISRTSINLLDDKTLPDIMNCLGNPNENFEGKRLRRGLIIGDVQSGKTATYSGLICKAADAGYKVVILLAGITETLRQQTQERIDEGIIGTTKIKEGKIIKSPRIGVGLDNKAIRAISLTSRLNDFVGDCANITMSLHQNSLVIFVVKKNVSVLRKMLEWLTEQNINPTTGNIDVPMLLIDDEADNASVNTRKDETNPTMTNHLIRQICNLFKNASYVGFTATPFANVFIDPDSVDKMQRADLFPEHFIYALEAPSNYVGANQIFNPQGPYFHNLRYITDIDEPDYASEEYKEDTKYDIDKLNSGPFYYRHTKNWDGELPESLRESVLCFFLANVVRDLRGQISAPRSMLVNMSRFINVQRIITEHVKNIYEKTFEDIRYQFSDSEEDNRELLLYKELKQLWEKHFSQIKDVKFERVIKKEHLLRSIEKIDVITVNGSKSSGKLDYKKNPSLRVIAVGGLALSRGLTLEGLLVSYFYRNTSTFDVLMQMGRWFGYRHGYEDLFQIWTSAISAEWYFEVAKAAAELKDDIKNMREQELTPKDFGVKVRDNCSDLQITASNKMRTASDLFMQYSFYGAIYDTPYITYNVSHNKQNYEAVEQLTAKLFQDNYQLRYTSYKKSSKDINDPADGSSRYFANVPKEVIIDLLQNIKCSLANPRFNPQNILDFLQDPSNIGLDYWDIAFEGGESERNYSIPGLECIKYSQRTICECSRNLVQISSRRRVLSLREGRFALSESQIEEAKSKWISFGGGSEKRNVPLKAYFEYLPNRRPLFIIMLIEPIKSTADEQEKMTRMSKFRKELGDSPIVAFAIGCPGIKQGGAPVKYKVNKVFRLLNMEGEEPEEVDDEEQ